jgi:hypothetical protein
MIAQIATGEIDDVTTDDGKNAAVALARSTSAHPMLSGRTSPCGCKCVGLGG